MGQLNWLDFAIIGIVLISIIVSIVRGFVREALSLVTWIIALWVAFSFAPDLAKLFVGHIGNSLFRYALSFVSLLITTVILGALVNYLIATLVEYSSLSGTDRMLGMLFGVIRGVLLVGLFLVMAKFTSYPQTALWRQSLLIPQFQPLTTWLHGVLPTYQEDAVKLSRFKSKISVQ